MHTSGPPPAQSYKMIDFSLRCHVKATAILYDRQGGPLICKSHDSKRYVRLNLTDTTVTASGEYIYHLLPQ